MPNNKIRVHSFTRSYTGISNQIVTPITVKNPYGEQKIRTSGIWDTGATGSVITSDAARELNLPLIGKTKVKGVHGYKDGINIYPVRIIFNEQLSFVVPVTECEVLADDHSCNLLIGMDIITKGDFSITNFQGNTVMSFRVPSIQRVDFVEETHAMSSPTPKSELKLKKVPGRNDPCPCGSGKKYKHCHGKTG